VIQYDVVKTFKFKKTYQDTKIAARTGVIHTPHGDIETPAFVPVGTQAGGLHRFMGWDGPIITDSGGFQVFSLGREKYSSVIPAPHQSAGSTPAGILKMPDQVRHDNQYDRNDSKGDVSPTLVKITDDGVTFRSHWDGSEHIFTPEKSMQYQWTLGSDIHIAFDDCTPYGVTRKQAEKSLERTHQWAERSIIEHRRQKTESRGQKKLYQALYGSIQGSIFKDLREKSAKFITSLPFDGYAVGGVAVGESKEEMRNVLKWVSPLLPACKPHHLLGVGEIDDIFTLVEHGIDTFDCVQPTRLARMGRVYCHRDPERSRGRSDLYNRDCFVLPQSGTPRNDKQYEIDILKSEFASDMKPIEKRCGCYTCKHFTRAYLHHLFKVRELLGYRLATIHNIAFINRLMSEIRLAIGEGSLVALKEKWGISEDRGRKTDSG